MRTHRLLLFVVLVVALSSPLSVARAEDLPSDLVGTWELVGFGDVARDVVMTSRVQIAIDATGRFDYQSWENGGAESIKLWGVWTVKDNVLKMQPRDAQALKAGLMVYRIEWKGNALLLYPTDDGNREPVPLRFEHASWARTDS